MPVGLVVVSHSRPLAEAAVELALIMVHGERPPIEIAAGTDDGGFGTDAAAVMEAIMSANAGDGVAIFVDLGSALTSTDMALEMLEDMGEEIETRVLAAPFVEGLTAAVVLAAGGADLDAIATEATSSLAPKLELLGSEVVAGEVSSGSTKESPTSASETRESQQAAPQPPDAAAEVQVVNKVGLHARPSAEIAGLAATFSAAVALEKDGREVNAKSPISIATLAATCGDTVRVLGRGEDALAAVTAIKELIASGFGEELGVPVASSARSASSSSARADSATVSAPGSLADDRKRPRTGVSPGRALGILVKLDSAAPVAPKHRDIPETEVPAETARLTEALAATAAAYETQAAEATGQAKAIIEATASLAADPELAVRATSLVQTKSRDAESAWWEAATALTKELRDAGGLIAERATDLEDVRARVLARLQGKTLDAAAKLLAVKEPFVLAAKDLAPADTARLPETKAIAIVTEEGGPTSHTTLLARAMGIPAVIGVPLDSLQEGKKVLVDGKTGEVIANPSAEQARGALTAPATLVKLTKPGATKDGVHIELLANIGKPEEAQAAADAGAEGIGLFRTEFAYFGKTEEPSVAAQTEAYAKVIRAFTNDKNPTPHVTIRTLDAGSDKPLKFLPLPQEPNPALGVRGYRTAKLFPDVLKRQLDAIAAGAPEAWMMAPMIALPEEAAAFAELTRAAGLKQVGVMIETPSAALCAKEIFEVVDFVSIGTNDLAQYTFAADRESAELGHLQNPASPAMLRLIAQIGAAAIAADKPLGVCGEAAGNPDLAPVLVGLGVTSLSMNPRRLANVSAKLQELSFPECQQLAKESLIWQGSK
ncbi:phosphoenolpyruvate--protein phosphotransferase [Mobiluncus porci]|uniref:Phosphocarrier protein HPr n=1 Tax=Mobiluncus porci TaxID=2652278 RepID=A0A7K0K377_9ACTO|nr:phosphoenolpyruvate--protein phosphotransferase [Mobiluncus porci]MST49868.1 phosphoenolpyruvate--protein phosphotransferase [Mobiluncus porci]